MPATRNSTSRYTNHHHHNHHHDGMAPKDESEASASSASSAPDPFTNDIRVPASQWPVLALGTVVFLPVRAVLVVLVLVLSWALAVVGTAGLSDRHIETKVMTGWRRKLARAYSYFGLLCFYAGGFRVKVVGRRAPRSEAPLLVGAPHSSFLEALVVVMCESSPVSRHENKTAFLIAACQRFYQTIFVDRRSSESRQQAAQTISDRARSKEDWLQIFIFPEGTNTNRRSLIKYKLGAFKPGVPVQPVLLRYPGYDQQDSVTWTWRQPHSYVFSLWLLLSRPLNAVEIEFLPVYRPSAEEVEDAELFSCNVQRLMADALGVPATDVTYHDYYKEYCQKYHTD